MIIGHEHGLNFSKKIVTPRAWAMIEGKCEKQKGKEEFGTIAKWCHIFS